ncbi:heme exporter protein CcmD [Alteromonas sp. CYL-A6]|uniref:heme exporter protein CcmD n=1 Tax=Alteromonas nitratireducens TaxID=3390813 RepID=UPI0034B5BACE
MQFESFEAFLHMGGYGFYVWLSFGITLIAMVAISVQSHRHHARLLKNIVKEKARQARIRAARKN